MLFLSLPPPSLSLSTSTSLPSPSFLQMKCDQSASCSTCHAFAARCPPSPRDGPYPSGTVSQTKSLFPWVTLVVAFCHSHGLVASTLWHHISVVTLVILPRRRLVTHQSLQICLLLYLGPTGAGQLGLASKRLEGHRRGAGGDECPFGPFLLAWVYPFICLPPRGPCPVRQKNCLLLIPSAQPVQMALLPVSLYYSSCSEL